MDWNRVRVTQARAGCILCRVWFDDPADARAHQCLHGAAGIETAKQQIREGAAESKRVVAEMEQLAGDAEIARSVGWTD